MDLPGLLHISVLAERRAQGPNLRQMMKDRISADLCLTSREGREAEVGYGEKSAPEARFRLYQGRFLLNIPYRVGGSQPYRWPRPFRKPDGGVGGRSPPGAFGFWMDWVWGLGLGLG